jgi:ubiquinone/menaquinone biosynthesis C-methylase UbiE
MKTHGEKFYINMPLFAARLYDNLTNVKGVNKTFEEIANFIAGYLKQGKVLDVGTGHGRLLLEINKQNQQIDLYGLDVSSSMLELARLHLREINNIDLRVGNIIKTEYQDDFFDCIVCSGSFYNWDKPTVGLNEIFRILKSGKTAYLFESKKDYNRDFLDSRLQENLKDYGFIRKTISKYFLRKQLRMTYSIAEFDEIIKQTKFEGSYHIQEIELGNLPIWLKIELKKITINDN